MTWTIEHASPAKLLTLPELHDNYRISRSAAYRLIEAGKIDRKKVGSRTLILRSSVEAFFGLTISEA